jgi:hypothetical protein
MRMVLWRLEALATPAWHAACARCGGLSAHDSTDSFRVNSNGERHDVWLLYRCRDCGDTRKRRLAHRRLASELPGGLAPYLMNDAACARRHAFELRPQEPLPYRVLRPALPEPGAAVLCVRIVQPEPCGERWDRLLARELGCPRAQVARAAARGALRLDGARSLARPVQDGQGFSLLR